MKKALRTARSGRPDLTECDREPIHVPGHIQPHGVLVATYPDDRRISHVSANILDCLGISPEEVIDRPLGDLLGPAASVAMEAALASASYAPSNVLTLSLAIPERPERRMLAHRHQGRVILEIETSPEEQDPGLSIFRTQSIFASLGGAQTVDELCFQAARQIRLLTGYDRVMIYRFDEDGHGEVVAEDRLAEIEPFLHLRYPASDIPQQARKLYVLQRVRCINDVDYVPARVLAAASANAPLDMSYCALRGVSPVHLEYMRNMGVRASLGISLLRDSQLWGLIVCHHGTPKTASAGFRALADVIGQVMSAFIQTLGERDVATETLRRHGAIAAIRAELEPTADLGRALVGQGQAMLSLMNATGALVSLGGATSLIGEGPRPDRAIALVQAMRDVHAEEIAGISDAGRTGGIAADCADTASGILVMPILNNPGDAIAWFRPERIRTVRWGGDPTKPVTRDGESGRLSPRKSFAAWGEVVRGHAAPWTPVDLRSARDLRRAITGVLLRHAESQLAQLSAYDPLTTLANRRTLKAEIERSRVATNHTVASMLFIDLDRFKAVNDLLGHAAGDQVLIDIAARLRRLTPADGLAGRLGGDEFVIFWPGAGVTDAENLADTLQRELSEPIDLEGRPHQITVSIGIATSEIADLDDLLSRADEAMYVAKRGGGGKAVLFRAGLHDSTHRTIQLQQDLFRAVRDRQIEVHYQPIIAVVDRRVIGFEALARWRNPNLDWISPAEFIPLAEESGLILEIGAWVLTTAIRQLAEWRRSFGELSMSINVSPRQLTEGDLSTTLRDVLATEQMPAEAVTLEVTETVLMQDAAVAELHRLRGLGVKVAVDDFGTGYSSLSYLQRLPVDVVKIDRGFVTPLGSDSKANRLFATIVNLAQTLDLGTVAEGCETQPQWDIIAEAGCEAIQGWLIARAANASDTEKSLRREWRTPPASATRA